MTALERLLAVRGGQLDANLANLERDMAIAGIKREELPKLREELRQHFNQLQTAQQVRTTVITTTAKTIFRLLS